MLPLDHLPRRIFLDTSVLQVIAQYGEFLFENVEPEEPAAIYRFPGGFEELNALRWSLFINQRGAFEYAVSENGVGELVEKGDDDCTRYAYDMFEYWNEISAAWPPTAVDEQRAYRLDGPSFGYLSVNDRRLVRDAVGFGCHAFLTLDRKLLKNRRHLQDSLGMRVLQPTDLWEILSPWAAIF